MAFLGAYFFFNQIKVKNKILQHEKEVSELIRRQEISSMEAMISGQEAERKRVGRELHDNIGSMLSTLGMHFSTAFEKSTGKEVSEVPEAVRVIELLDNTISETRKLSHDMMAGVLNRFGLVSAIRDLCDQISETGKVNVLLNSIGMDERLEAMMELNLYRIAQELVSNALKHADPETIRINLVRKIETVVLQVKDDGMGMTYHQFENGNGAGFSNVSGRVAALKGKLEFEKKQEQGTLIRIVVPTQKLKTMAYKVALVDDHQIIIDGLMSLLQDETSLSIVDFAITGKSALAMVKEHDLDVLILDIHMPDMDGIEVLEEIRKTNSELKVIMLTMHDEPAFIRSSLEKGANGYMLKKYLPK